jgi:hypothetical protein
MAGRALDGDWVIIGGSVLPLVGAEGRVTVDIDIAGPADAGQDQTLALMDIAERLGLPVEAINQAGAFFLRRIEGWEREIVLVHEGPRARIHRPSVTLFVLLKIGRMSESDLADCVDLARWAGRPGERPDVPRLIEAIGRAVDESPGAARRARLGTLASRLR